MSFTENETGYAFNSPYEPRELYGIERLLEKDNAYADQVFNVDTRTGRFSRRHHIQKIDIATMSLVKKRSIRQKGFLFNSLLTYFL